MLSLVLDPSARGRVGGARLDRLRRRIGRMVRAAALAEEDRREELEVVLRLCDDAVIRELNRSFRDKDRPTDVLAFSLREGRGGALHPHVLGDIDIPGETAARPARRGLEAEILFLAAHGLCHLLGYDHRDDAEEARMNARMAQLLAECARRGRVRAA